MCDCACADWTIDTEWYGNAVLYAESGRVVIWWPDSQHQKRITVGPNYMLRTRGAVFKIVNREGGDHG